MNKKELKQQIEETKTQLKTISKDTHHCEVLIDKLMSLKGQTMIEPTLIHIPTSDVISSIDGNTFTMTKTKQGVVYHQKNGFDMFIPLNGMTYGLYEQIDWLIEYKDKIDQEEVQEIKDFYMYAMLEVGYTFQMLFGLWMNDKDFVELRSKYINEYAELITRKYQEISDGEIQEETHEENSEFEKSVMALEDIKAEVTNSEL